MVSVDLYQNETTRHADVILPPPSPLERSHYDLTFYRAAIRHVANYSPAVFPAPGPSEAEILARLALIAGGKGAGAAPDPVYEDVIGGFIDAEIANPHSPIAGRDPGEIDLAYIVAWYDETKPHLNDDGSRRLFTGSPEQIAGDIDALKALGFGTLVLSFARRSVALSTERMELFAREIRPLAGA